jgi:hypothetical protein
MATTRPWRERCLALAIAFLAIGNPATAQTSFSDGGVTIDFPNWVVSPASAGDVEYLVQISPADASQPPFRTCRIEKRQMDYPPGVSQTDINSRLTGSAPNFWTSPTYRQFGRVSSVTTSEVDGVVVADVVVQGDGDRTPSYTRDRQFVVLRRDTQGEHYRMICISMSTPDAEQRADIEQIISSLRIVY